MKILFIGGNGNISWWCTQKALECGHEVWHLNREQTVLTRRKVQKEVKKLKCDIRQKENVRQIIEPFFFDVVCDFICYNAEHARNDIEIFKNKTKHFVFISSESVYKRKSSNIPYTEADERYKLELCDCEYISGKIQAEDIFYDALKKEGFPVTIIRPAYTYDTIFPISIGQNCFTAETLILKGKPLLIAGDGNSLRTFTHSMDFANAFVPLIENPDTVGETFHISTDEWITWNEQSEIVLKTLKSESNGMYHIPFKDALELTEIQPREMMYQRMCHSLYCTDKVKKYVPNWSANISFEEGIGMTLKWLNQDMHHKRYVDSLGNAINNIYERYGIADGM